MHVTTSLLRLFELAGSFWKRVNDSAEYRLRPPRKVPTHRTPWLSSNRDMIPFALMLLGLAGSCR